GEGFELRTDGHGALRASNGMLITTEARANAANHVKDLGETATRLHTAWDQHQQLAEAAQAHRAQETSDDQDIVQKALEAQHQAIAGEDRSGDFPELAAPHLVMASPTGIEASTPASIHLHSQQHTALTSQGHTSLSIAKRWLASAAEGVRAFTHKQGLKLIASEDPVEIQAHQGETLLVAHKDVRITSIDGEIHVTAKKKVVVVGGGSYSEWGPDGITHGTAGTWMEHAAMHSRVGPMSQGTAMPEFARGAFNGQESKSLHKFGPSI
ncbi:DUF2345 domain-containing protein, partial [Variovorax arabinosiphilus]